MLRVSSDSSMDSASHGITLKREDGPDEREDGPDVELRVSDATDGVHAAVGAEQQEDPGLLKVEFCNLICNLIECSLTPRDPQHFKALFNQGFSYDKIGECDRAIADYTQAPHTSIALDSLQLPSIAFNSPQPEPAD